MKTGKVVRKKTIDDFKAGYSYSLKALDPSTGKIVWEYKNKASLWGGVLTTAGGLVFIGTPEGYLKAFDAKSGKEVWKFQAGTGVVVLADHLDAGR